jgi:hypothetical protein
MRVSYALIFLCALSNGMMYSMEKKEERAKTPEEQLQEAHEKLNQEGPEEFEKLFSASGDEYEGLLRTLVTKRVGVRSRIDELKKQIAQEK